MLLKATCASLTSLPSVPWGTSHPTVTLPWLQNCCYPASAASCGGAEAWGALIHGLQQLRRWIFVKIPSWEWEKLSWASCSLQVLPEGGRNPSQKSVAQGWACLSSFQLSAMLWQRDVCLASGAGFFRFYPKACDPIPALSALPQVCCKGLWN